MNLDLDRQRQTDDQLTFIKNTKAALYEKPDYISEIANLGNIVLGEQLDDIRLKIKQNKLKNNKLAMESSDED